jgi:hypothetical protein
MCVAMTAFMKSWCMTHWIRLGAKTGKAAARCGGYTHDSLMAKSMKNEDDKGVDIITVQQLKNLNVLWRLAQFYFVDEISMFAAEDVGDMSTRMAAGKNCINAPFGGCNLILCGDLCQKRPPKSRAVYDSILNPNIVQARGVTAWQNVQFCVDLWLNKRAEDDELFAACLSDLRFGLCVQPHADYLNQRSLPSLCPLPVEEADALHMALFGTTRNSVRTILGSKQIIYFARSVKQRVIIVVAEDSCKKVPHIPFKRRRELLAMADGTSTSYLPGLLMLVPGAPITLKTNLLPSSFLFNSSRGTFVSMVLHPDEPDYDNDYELGPHFLKYQPISISVNIPDATHLQPVKCDDQPLAHVPVANLTLGPVSLALYANGHQKGDPGLTRKQFPIVAGRGYTDFNLQSDTVEERYLVDSMRHKGQISFTTALYVLLSRVKRLDLLYLITKIKLADLQEALSDDLLAELARIEFPHSFS